MFKAIPKETKEQILSRVKNGIPVTKAAFEHGISPKTIYGWLARQSQSSPSFLELGRLKRERDDLLKIIGELTLEINKHKKKRVY